MDSNKWHQKSSLQDFKITEEKKPQQQLQQNDDSKLIRRVSKRNIGIKKSLASEIGQIFETFEPQQKKQSKTDVMHFVFSSLSEAQLQQLAQQMFYCRLIPGQTIIKQGDSASSFFILEKGKIQVQVNGVPKKELVTGNGFGELALLYNAPRSATCIAQDECFLWGIDRHTFRKTVEEIMRSELEKNRKYLEEVKFFSKSL